jgi:hypothetical protein
MWGEHTGKGKLAILIQTDIIFSNLAIKVKIAGDY